MGVPAGGLPVEMSVCVDVDMEGTRVRKCKGKEEGCAGGGEKKLRPRLGGPGPDNGGGGYNGGCNGNGHGYGAARRRRRDGGRGAEVVRVERDEVREEGEHLEDGGRGRALEAERAQAREVREDCNEDRRGHT